MVLFRDTRRFEVTLEERYGAWQARLQALSPDRLYPTVYLLHTYTTREEALGALQRRWHTLFPDEEPLAWHEPMLVTPPPSPPRRPRASEGS